jgi:hypothetical protein
MKRTQTSLRYAGALALGLAALGAPAKATAQEAQVENGFALEASLAGRTSVLTVANNLNNVGLPGNGLATGLFAGYKASRLIIGLGLEFFNATLTTSAGNVSTTTSTSAFLIGPEVMFAVFRAADNRVDLFLDAALHFGHEFIPAQGNPPPPMQPSNFLLSYQIGPGVRFWAHRHFAIQGLTGFAGELFHEIPPAGANASGDLSVHGILGQFGMLGVF